MSRNRIAQMLAFAVAGVSLSSSVARAQSAYFSATGTFTDDDSKRQFFDFALGGNSLATFRTLSGNGGTNAAGDVIPAGGVDADLFLLSGGGLITWNDDTFGTDAYIQQNLGAGTYRLEQAFFYPPNSHLWAVDMTTSGAAAPMTLTGLPNNGGPGVDTLAFGGDAGATAVLGIGTGNLIQVNNAIRAKAGGVINMTGGGTLSVASLDLAGGSTFNYVGGTYAVKDARVGDGALLSIGTASVLNVGAPGNGGYQGMWLDRGTLSGHQLNVGNGATGSFNHGTGAAGSLENLNVGLGGLSGAGLYRIDSGTLTVTNAFYLGSGAGVGTFDHVGGTVYAHYFYIGDNAGRGTYNLDDGTLNAITVSAVGTSGDATFNQTGGLHQSGFNNIAAYATGAGTYLLSGGTLVTPQTWVGNLGRGTFTQTGGYNLSTAMTIAAGSTAFGTYTLGGGTLQTSTLTINNNGTFLYNGGNFLVANTKINPGGRLTAGALLALGVGPVSSTVNLAGGTFDGYSAEVGHTGAATVNETSGLLSMTYLTVGGAAGGAGTFNLSGGEISTYAFGVLVGAFGGTGTFNQTGGVVNTYYAAVGGNNGSTIGTGTWLLSAGTINAGEEIAGDASRGTILQTGGVNNTTLLTVAKTPGSHGTFSLAGGTLSASTLTVNANGLFTYTNGAFNVATTNINGGTFVVNNPSFNLGSPSANTMNLTAGVLSGSSEFNVGGAGGAGVATYNQSGGTDTIPLTGAGIQGSGSGTINLSGGTISGGEFSLGVFDSANGYMFQSGGLVHETNLLSVGGYGSTPTAGARGTYQLSGGTITVDGRSEIGYFASGTFTQTNGSHTTAHLVVGAGTTGFGTYALSGGTLQTGDAQISQTGGTGTFLQTGGVHSTGTLYINGSSVTTNAGTYLLNSGTLNVGTLQIAGAGKLIQQGGVLNVGTINAASAAFVRYYGYGGTLNITGAAGLTVSPNNSVGPIFYTYGALNSANGLTVDGGATLTITNGTLNVGSASNSGTVALDNATANFGAGLANTGALQITGGSAVSGVIDGTPSSSVQVVGYGNRLAAGAPRGHETGTLSFAPGARLDMADNSIVIDYDGASPISDIASQIKTAYQGGDWLGTTGLTSSTVYFDNQAGKRTAVGYAEASTIGLAGGTFAGRNVDDTSLLVRYTLAGDANLDRTVDLTDFTFLAANFNGTNRTWSQGDYNYDGTVDLTDFTILAANFNHSLTAATDANVGTLVPEPTTAAVLICAAFACSGRRRRRTVASQAR